MFKWSKHRPITDPSRTPFLKSVALPEVASPVMQAWPAQVMGQTATRSAHPHRSMTPALRQPQNYSEPTRPRTSSTRVSTDQPIKGILKKSKNSEMEEKARPPSRAAPTTSSKLTENQPARPRTSSNAQAPIKGILKPAKVYPIHPDDFPKPKEKPVIPPTPEPNGRPGNIYDSTSLTKKTSKEGGGYSHHSASENHLENSTSHHDYPERQGRAPSHFYQPSITAPQPMRPVDPPRVPENYNQSSNGNYQGSHSQYGYGTQAAHQRPVMMHQAASYPVTRTTSYTHPPPLHLPPTHGQVQNPHYGGPPQQSAQHPVERIPSHTGSHMRQLSSRERSDSARGHNRQRSNTDIYRGVAPGPDGVVPVFPKIPPKEPQVSLSWPLIGYQLRQQKRQSTPKIHFDLGLHPGVSLKAYLHGMSYTQPLLENDYMQSVSSHCDLREMKVVCAGLERWPFTIRKSSKIRCFDVFEQIHEHVTKPLTPEEQASFSRGELHAMQPYFEERIHNTPALDYVTRRKGLCRIDVLKSKKMFKEVVRDKSTGLWVVLTEEPLC